MNEEQTTEPIDASASASSVGTTTGEPRQYRGYMIQVQRSGRRGEYHAICDPLNAAMYGDGRLTTKRCGGKGATGAALAEALNMIDTHLGDAEPRIPPPAVVPVESRTTETAAGESEADRG